MRKIFLLILAVLLMAPMLSGCFYYPYHDDWNGRGYRHNGGYHEDRRYDGRGDGYREYRERR